MCIHYTIEVNVTDLSKAQNELAEFLIKYPEHLQFQLSIDAALEKIGDNPTQRMLWLSRMMQHYVADIVVELTMLDQDIKEIKNKSK